MQKELEEHITTLEDFGSNYHMGIAIPSEKGGQSEGGPKAMNKKLSGGCSRTELIQRQDTKRQAVLKRL